jgi:hypothetical protein
MTKPKHRTSLPEIPFCGEKFRLIEEFATVYQELAELQTHHAQGIVVHDPDLIHTAQQRKDKAICAVIAHISEHHCW